MGRDFADNALPIDAEREGVRLTGFAGLPTLNRRPRPSNILFVNGRPVRDRLLQGAVRGAYQDFLARDRHPLVALFLELPAEEVDVNVHPAKAEVRFRDPGLVRGLIVGALRHALAAAGHRASHHRGRRRAGQLPPGRHGRVMPASASPPGGAAGPRASRCRAGSAEQAAALYAPFDGSSGRTRRVAATSGATARPRRRAIRWARRARSCTRPTSSPRPPTASSSSTSTPPMSGWSMSG